MKNITQFEDFINESMYPSQSKQVPEGRNNPDWINLVSKLKTTTYPPKILTFNSADTPPIPSQSLNWGTAKTPNGKYIMAIASTDFEQPKEHIVLHANDRNSQKQKEMEKWWMVKGYKVDKYGAAVLINFKDGDKLKNDINSFFKIYPPQ